MQIFGYVLRKPWTKYVDLELEDDVYDQIRVAVCKTVTANLVLESLDKELCDDECEVFNYMKQISKDTR